MKAAMKPQTWLCFLAQTARMAFICLLLVCVSGCATDKEYAQKLATARTDCKGNEISGIWVSKFKDMRITLLLRPDGTGREITKSSAGNHFECEIKWRYSGGGAWAGTDDGLGVRDAISSPLPSSFTLRFTGNELLLKEQTGNFFGGWHMWSMVFVPADNEAAVEEHLKKR